MPETPQRILVFAVRAIGDVVLSTPIIKAIKTTFPSAYLAVLADGVSAEILHHNPYIDRLIRIDRVRSRKRPFPAQVKEWFDLIADIRHGHFDVTVDLFSGPRTALLSWISGASTRIAEDFRKALRGFLYTHPVKIHRDGRHLVEQKLELIRPLIGEIVREEAELNLWITEEEQGRARALLGGENSSGRKRIGLVPGAGSIWRIWPAERFAVLADRLINDYAADVFLLGSANDSAICHQISTLMATPPRNLSGQTTLRELMAVLGELDLVVSNVTGPLHMASALAKPRVVGLYGAADTIQYAPWGGNVTMVTKGQPDEAYWRRVDYRRDHQYLLQVEVKDVLAAVDKVMPV